MRSMWKGSISFGLVNIPIRMYTATQAQDLSFNQLHTLCHTPIRYQKYCPHCQVEVPKEDLVRGYEYEPGSYVVISDDEWESFATRQTHTVDILRFVELSEVDPVYYNKTYYLEPAETGGKAYALLRQALSQSNKIAIATITIRSKPALSVIRTYDDLLALETIFFPDEIRDPAQLASGAEQPVRDQELEMAISLIASLTERFQPEHYQDLRRQGLLEFLERKIRGQETVKVEQAEQELPAIDLLAALQASLEAQDGMRH